MAIQGKITTLYKDKEKTQALFPRTKTSAVTDDNGKSLNAIIEETIKEEFRVSKENGELTGPPGKIGPVGPRGERGIPNEQLSEKDTRDDNQNPAWYLNNYGKSIITEFKHCSKVKVNTILSGEYCNLTTITPWTDSSGGMPVQFAVNDSTEGLGAYRCSLPDGTGWTPWKQIGGTPQIRGSYDSSTQVLQLFNAI